MRLTKQTLSIVHFALCIAVMTPCAMLADSGGTWVKRTGVGTGGTDWTGWNDTDNWNGGTVASGSGSTAVANISAATGQYIDIPSALSIYDMNGDSGNPPIVGGDGVLSIYHSIAQVYLYAPFALRCAKNNDGPKNTQFCGPCTAKSGEIPLVTGTDKFRTDLYATAAGGTRSETIWPCQINTWGAVNFHFIAPHGSDSDTIANWSMTAGSPFLSRAVGQAEHVLSVGTAVSGAGIPEGTFLKRVFPDGTVELSSAATNTSASAALTFAAFDSSMIATINGNIHRGPWGSNNTTCTLYVQKYREEDEFTVSAQKLSTGNASWDFKVATESGFLPGVLSVTGVNISGATPLKITLENCHVKIAGDSFANANFLLPGSAHKARLTVAGGESHSMGALGSLKGTLVKDGAGTLSANLNGGNGSYTGTLVVESGVFSIANEGVFLTGVSIKAGATLDAPEGVHIGTLTAEPGAIIAGGRIKIDAANGETMDNITLDKGAFITDAIVSSEQFGLSVVKGEGDICKLNADEMLATFNTNSILRIEGCGEVDVLVVGGGGGGGTMWGGGGGGGGVIYRQKLLLTNGLYGVTVGLGGIGVDSRLGINGSGGNSAFYGLTAFGGGAGGTYGGASGRSNPASGVSGSSGGGGGIIFPALGEDRSSGGGSGVEGQGHDGGRSIDYRSSGGSFLAGGGGGGAGSVGQNATTNSVGQFVGSCGGDGVMCAITDAEVYYGGGGGGAGNKTAVSGSGIGGAGGGGNGSFGSGSARGVAGTDGLGGGGGGGRAQYIDSDPGSSGGGAKGGRGVVIIRYSCPVEHTLITFR